VVQKDNSEEPHEGSGIQFIDSIFNINDVFSDMSEAGEDPGLGDEEYHYKKVWNVIKGVRRHKHKHPEHKHSARPMGVQAFFGSAVFYEWCIFAMALSVFFPLFWYLQDWPSTRKFHVVALFIWIALGALYNFAVWTRLGRNAGVMWFTGYLLEFIFSIENVFVFHIVVKAFRTPQRLTQKAIFIVICCQIVFEMIFFMGLAARVRSMEVLPYLLGVWLLYVGYHAGKDDGYDDFNIKDSAIFRLSHWVLGRRLMLTYEENGSVFLFKERRLCVSLLFPLICCLLAVDFFLEVDVTLTKIEELPNEYIAFTSSAAAAFAVPELFFVARDLFQRFFLLKYGVSFVLVFFGIQMLMHRFCDLPDLVGCAIIIVVMIVCMVASSFLGKSKQDMDQSPYYDGESHFEAKNWSKEPAPEPPCKDP
jgi:tellurite resistance protein TerC